MTIDRFWEIIDKSREGADDDQEMQKNNLHALLMDLEHDEIVAFEIHFHQMRSLAYRSDLWGVAYIINGGCSDDGFEYFRWALIAAGRQRFERALENPESIADWCTPENSEFENFAYVSTKVFKAKTGGLDLHFRLDERSSSPASKLAGEPWTEEDLPTRFPKVWAKFEG